MIKKLVRHGNSFALILDKPVLDLLKVDPARPLEVSTTDGKSLVIAPAAARSSTSKRHAFRQRIKRRSG
jgi:antitoxin component of MazEF toxin-antitoxin module